MARPIGERTSLLRHTLGHYRILEKIGEGGMGDVYRARDDHLGRDVAIKVLSVGVLNDDHARKHFRKEADALSRLNHPNIATIYDFDTQAGVDFMVMEYIPGETLSDKLRKGPMPEKEVVRLGLQVAEGLAAAHEHRIVHRDMKPGNLRLTRDGGVKILDFGLAKLLRSLSPTTSTESTAETVVFAGTLPYMAPEQLRGEAMDQRTDIYGLGMVLYEMVTGQRPFGEKVSAVLMDDILHLYPPPPGRLRQQLSPRLEDIILKCLEKDPGNRYRSARELAVDLKRMERDSELRVISKEETARRGPDLVARSRRALLVTTTVLLLAAGIAGLFLSHKKRERTPRAIEPTIAVLPFVNMSPGKDQEYFSDGLAEELLNSLAKIEGLHVVARTSSFQFKGKTEDLRIIAQKLNVATILGGSVRREGNRVRISAQLVNAADGFHLWSEMYDRELKDIFVVQEEIARSVAESLRVKLLGKSFSPRATSVDAYNAYLQGKYFYAPEFDKPRLEKAVSYYEQAINLDPNYAPAWAALSIALSAEADYSPTHEEIGRAREAAERALVLDPNLADASAAAGIIKYLYDWDWNGADVCYQRALSLEPGNVGVVMSAAELAATMNRFDEALRLSRRAVELDPLSASAYRSLAFVGSWAGRLGLDEADSAARKALELNPELPWAHMLVSGIYLARGRPEQALAEAEREKSPGFRLQGLALAYHALARKEESDRALAKLITKYRPTMAFQIAQVFAYRGQSDLALVWLERAYVQHDTGLTGIKGDSLLKNLEGDPRYAAFLKKMRLPA